MAVFRVIPAELLTVDQLAVTKEVQQLCYLTKGLVLVTGPTGSGKSTTLCALIDLINRTRHDHIITIEDPIEFVHENKKCLITQRQVGLHTQGFKHALRAALREDPGISCSARYTPLPRPPRWTASSISSPRTGSRRSA
jgi:twitching motility protein PilT